MAYRLYLQDHQISGPFSEKSEAWADATKRGLVTVIPAMDEDPPRQILNLRYSIRATTDACPSNRVASSPHAAAP
jgi:hypothetical protein